MIFSNKKENKILKSERRIFERKNFQGGSFHGMDSVYLPVRKTVKVRKNLKMYLAFLIRTYKTIAKSNFLKDTFIFLNLIFRKNSNYSITNIKFIWKKVSLQLDNIFESFIIILRKKFKISIQKKWFKRSFATVLILVLMAGLFTGNNKSYGYTYTFQQDSWAGGTSVNNANHTDNKTGWTNYTSSSNLTVGSTITLPNNNNSITQTDDGTTNTGFNLTGKTFSQAEVNGTGSGASVKLSPVPSGFGTGADGAWTISTAKNINTDTNGNGGRTCADGISYNVTALTANTATLSGMPPAGCYAAGDQVMLLNEQGDGTTDIDMDCS